MSNFLHKGKRQIKQQQVKNSKHVVGNFQKTLLAMNEVYVKLSQDENLNEDNFINKVKDITSFSFSEKQLDMLRRDLLTTTTTDEQQPTAEEDPIAFTE